MSASQITFEPEPGHDAIVRVVFEHFTGTPNTLFRLQYPRQGQMIGGPTTAEEVSAILTKAAAPLNEALRRCGDGPEYGPPLAPHESDMAGEE